MPRMSNKRRLEWSFFLNHRNRITYILFTGENFRKETAQAKLNGLKELLK